MSLDQIDVSSTALLVLDVQNAFCHPDGTLGISGVDIGPARRIIDPLKTLIEKCRSTGMPVIWTLQVHFEHDASRGRKRFAPHTAKRKRVAALAGSWDAQLVDELAPLADDPMLVIVKHRYGAFYETRLDQVLRMLGTQALLVTGTTTNACVETTIREAYLRDYDVVAVTDCTAAVRPDWEQVAHQVWSHYLAELATSAEVAEWIDRAQEPKPISLGHALLRTGDLAAAERFYVETLGFRVRKREAFRDGGPLIVTEQGLGLTEGRQGDATPVDHFAFSVRGVAALAERAVAGGYRIVRDLGEGPYGLTVYVADPDGNEIELYEQG